MKKKLFLVTRTPKGLYNFIINPCVADAEKKTKKKLILKKFKYKFHLTAVLFTLKNIFNLIIFDKHRLAKLNFNEVQIGRYIIAEIYSKPNSYNSIIVFLYNAVINIFKAVNIYLTTENLSKKIDAAYIDHCIYINGIIVEVLTQKNILIYSNNYPKNLFCFKNISKNKKICIDKIIELKKNDIKTSKKDLINAEKYAYKIIKNTNTLPWMKSITFKSEKIDRLSNATHFIYAHSFTDGQLMYGYDGFVNIYDWIYFTLNTLSKNKKNLIFVKAHPWFYHPKNPNGKFLFDRNIFLKLKKKFQSDNIIFIKEPIENFKILKQLKKDTILISHHGTAILEGLYYNFKCITSQRTFWAKEFKLTNNWLNQGNYKRLLEKPWNKLNYKNKNDYRNVCFQLFLKKNGIFGKYLWLKIICDAYKVSMKEIWENIKFHKNLSKKKEKEVLKKIQKNIEQIAF